MIVLLTRAVASAALVAVTVRLAKPGNGVGGAVYLPAASIVPTAVVLTPAGGTKAQPIITMDLTASFLVAGGAKPQAALDGDDVLPVLGEKQPIHDRTFFWRLPRPDAKFGQKAVRRGKWKLIYDREVELLFDLPADPGERHNLAFQHPEIVAELRTALAEWERTLPAVK